MKTNIEAPPDGTASAAAVSPVKNSLLQAPSGELSLTEPSTLNDDLEEHRQLSVEERAKRDAVVSSYVSGAGRLRQSQLFRQGLDRKMRRGGW